MDRTTARRCLITLCGISCVELALAGPLAAQTLFTEVAEQTGLEGFRPYPRDMTFVDYDNDGLQDVFLVGDGWYPPPQRPRQIGLFRNTGEGRFTDETALLPVEVNAVIGGGGAVFGDYDSDGDEDLFLPVQPHNVLLRNDRGRFTIADPGTGLRDSMLTDNAIWLDYDRDGHLDLYVGNLGKAYGISSGINRLLRNLGDGTFADQTDEVGLGIEVEPVFGGSLGGMSAGDFNDDGWPDLYLGVLSPPGGLGAPNRLFLSDGQGGFLDATTSAIGDRGEAFAVAVGDIDNDADLDIFQAAGGYGEKLFRSPLLMNLGGGGFLDLTDASGLGVLGESTSSASFADIDNDGHLDLIVGSSKKAERPESFVLLNDGTGAFVDQSADSGLEDYGRIVVGDYDGDGFIDLVRPSVARAMTTLYRNNGNANHWLRVELVGVESNRSGIGARVLATSGDLAQMREILGGLGRCPDERVAHFGLGSRTQVDRLEIRWPSGQEDVLYDVPADQKIRVFEGREGYHPVVPTSWVSAPPEVVVGGARSRIAAVVKPALFEGEARIATVTADLSELGGPADLPLEPGEGGMYRLATTLQVDVPRGSYTTWVHIEQQTSLGDYWVRLSQQVMVVPREDLSVFGRAGDGGWTWYGEDLTRVTDDPSADYAYAWSPDGTRIAFLSYRDGNEEIYVCNADGGEPVNLTTSRANENHPSWSPDGTKIAFDSDRDGNWEVYVMGADGSNAVSLTDNEAVDVWPSWSPDGGRIAFFTNRDGNYEIYAMDADGGNPVNLTKHDSIDVEPSWSPGGSRIAFRSDRGADGIGVYVLDLESSGVAQLTEHGGIGSSIWSPDGTRVAFHDDRVGNLEIYVMDVDGGEPVRLTHHPAADYKAAWSPDDSRIAISSKRMGSFYEVLILTMGEASRVAIDPQQRGMAYTGGEALAVHAGAEWWLSCQPIEPFDWTGYAALHFAFHPGDLVTSEGKELSVWIDGNEVDLLSEGWVDPGKAEWQVAEIPLVRFALTAPIASIDVSGDFTGTFYVDDVRLVAMRPDPGVTAVEEDGEALPTAPMLGQNYPNPFNSATVIGFSLPEPGEAQLTVYNLAGQEVATLAQGELPAGVHTIRWDGRNDDGRELASGLYLYRLRAGGVQALTRKLVLIR